MERTWRRKTEKCQTEKLDFMPRIVYIVMIEWEEGIVKVL